MQIGMLMGMSMPMYGLMRVMLAVALPVGTASLALATDGGAAGQAAPVVQKRSANEWFQSGMARRQAKDFEEARRQLELAAAQDHVRAIEVLAADHSNGYGGPKDDERAFALNQRGAALGSVRCMMSYGLALMRRNQPGDRAAGLEWLEKSAKGGEILAMENLGGIYGRGYYGTPKDAEVALYWYEQAKARGALRWDKTIEELRVLAQTQRERAQAAERAQVAVARQVQVADAADKSVFRMSGAELGERIHARIQAGEAHRAYALARAWQKQSPEAAAPLVAMAQIHTALGMPAAALQAVDQALALGPNAIQRRMLHLLKIQAHAELGDFLGAWANAGTLFRRMGNDQDDLTGWVREAAPQLYLELMTAGPQEGPADELRAALEAHAGQPERLAVLVRERLSQADRDLAQATLLLREGEALEALVPLTAALAADPASEQGWQLLMELGELTGDDALAAAALEMRWSLHPMELEATGPMLALAAREGRWPLLLSLADHRTIARPGDAETHYYRLLAAVMLGLPGLATESALILDGTAYHDLARILHAAARGLARLNAPNLSHEKTGLEDVITRLGNGVDMDPVIRPWIALALAYPGNRVQARDQHWKQLEAHAGEDGAADLGFVRGSLTASAYLAQTRGTPREPLARLLVASMDLLMHDSPGHRARLTELAADARLTVLQRALAASMARGEEAQLMATLRPADRFHLPPWVTDWAPLMDVLLPGQQVVLSSAELNLVNLPLPVLRLAGLPGERPMVTPAALRDVRFMELEGLQFAVGDSQAGARLWTFDPEGILALDNVLLHQQSIGGAGTVWVEHSDLSGTAIDAAATFIGDSVADRANLTVRLESHLDRSFLHESNLTFDASAATPRAWITRSSLVHGTHLLKPVAGLQLHLSDTQLGSGFEVDFTGVQVTAVNSTLVSANAPGSVNIPGLTLQHLRRRGGGTVITVDTVEALIGALQGAQPGTIVSISPGTYEISRNLTVPPGVILTSRDPYRRPVLTTRGANPIIHIPTGAAALSNLEFRIQTGTTIINGREFNSADNFRQRAAVWVGQGASVFMSGLIAPNWNGLQAANRAEIRIRKGGFAVLRDSPVRHLHVDGGARAAYLGTPLKSMVSWTVGGAGEFFADSRTEDSVRIHGEKLHSQVLGRSDRHVRYADGAVDPRLAHVRDSARAHLWAVLADAKSPVTDEVNAAANASERREIMKRLGDRIGHIARAAQPDAADLAKALNDIVGPLMLRRPNEAGDLFEGLYINSRGIPDGVLPAHRSLLPANIQANLRRHGEMIMLAHSLGGAGGYRAGRDVAQGYMRTFPPGHWAHARAMEAARKGQPLEEFRQIIAAEVAARQRLAAAAARTAKLAEERKRKEAEAAALQAKLRAQQRWQASATPVRASWTWSSSSSSSSSSSYRSSSSSSGFSSDFQRQQYRQQLSRHIHNVGRDYGQGRRY